MLEISGNIAKRQVKWNIKRGIFAELNSRLSFDSQQTEHIGDMRKKYNICAWEKSI